MRVIETLTLPDTPEPDAIYMLPPVNPSDDFYNQRTDRNLGWISPEEQKILKNTTLGIAGLGGMGGPLAPVLLRMGIGTIKLADLEEFDASNINRQYGANRFNIGKPKAFETAKALRAITDDTTLIVYPRGINPAEVDHFVEGCDLVLDLVEFWAAAPRIMTHIAARKRGIPVINGNPVGFGTRLFFFDRDACSIEQFMGLTLEQATSFAEKSKTGTASKKDKLAVISSVMTSFVTEPVFYAGAGEKASSFPALRKRMVEEGRPAVLGSNLPLASGFLANHIVLYLLRNSGVRRHKLPKYPKAPGYLYFDSALVRAKIRRGGPMTLLRRWLYRQLVIRKIAASMRD